MSYNIQQALKEALEIAAKEKVKYQSNLVGKVFAYAYLNPKTSLIEIKVVEFKTENFLHLTGLDYKGVQYNKRVLSKKMPTYADEFFKRLGSDPSLIKDISFIQGDTKTQTADNIKTAQRKLRNLSQLVNIAQKAEYIGMYKNPDKFDLLINRSYESLALIKDGSVYIPISSRYGVVDKHIDPKDKNLVLAIFSRKSSERDFRLVYLNKKVNNVDKAFFDLHSLSNLSIGSFVNENVEFNIKAQLTIRHRYIISSVKSELAILAQKRLCAYNSETALDEYTKSRDNFIEHLKTYNEVESDEEKGEIVKVITAHYKEQLSKATELDNSELISQEEICKINEVYGKYHGLNLSINVGDEAFKRATTIADEIKSPSAQLLKNKINNFSLIPERKINLQSVHFKDGAIALTISNPRNPLDETIRNITARLSEVGQKISDFLSSSFHSLSQEQPSQAHKPSLIISLSQSKRPQTSAQTLLRRSPKDVQAGSTKCCPPQSVRLMRTTANTK